MTDRVYPKTTTNGVLTIILAAAVTAIILYLIYNPHRPSFTVSSLKVTTLNLTTTNIHLNVTAKNPNKNIIYFYNPITVSVLTSKNGILIGEGAFPQFVHGKKNTTFLRTAIMRTQDLDVNDSTSTNAKLKSELTNKNGVGIVIKMDTKVKVKLASMKTPKIGIRVTCQGIKVIAPSGKVTTTTASTADTKCKVDVRVKIWRWTF
ncbi:hypothetical protein ACFE04_008484 [Oxalis oulophora]